MTVSEVILSLLQCHTLDNETIIFLKSDDLISRQAAIDALENTKEVAK